MSGHRFVQRAIGARQLDDLLEDLLPGLGDQETSITRPVSSVPVTSARTSSSLSSSSSTRVVSTTSTSSARTSSSSSSAVRPTSTSVPTVVSTRSSVLPSSTRSSSPLLVTAAPVEDTPVLAPAPTPTSFRTVISSRIVEASAAPEPSAANSGPPKETGFLQNKTASGIVFGLIGAVGLLLLLMLIAFIMRRFSRKRRQDRMVDDLWMPPSAPSGNGLDAGIPGIARSNSLTSQQPSMQQYEPQGNRYQAPSQFIAASSFGDDGGRYPRPTFSQGAYGQQGGYGATQQNYQPGYGSNNGF